jgi:predicted enzyme related to lactoylglutathione lyase
MLADKQTQVFWTREWDIRENFRLSAKKSIYLLKPFSDGFQRYKIKNRSDIMKSPVKNHVGSIFIHVKDMNRAIAFYSALLGLPKKDTAHEGTIYDLPVSGGSGIILDANKGVVAKQDAKPLFFYDTNDIYQSYDHVKSINAEIFSEIEEHGDISFFNFRDSEGNLLMICEDKRKI